MLSPGAPSLRELRTYAVFPLEGEPALVVDSLLFAVNAADIWVQDLHLFGGPGMDHTLPPGELSDTEARFLDLLSAPQRHASPTDTLLAILKDRGLLGARIGLEMEEFPEATKRRIYAGLPDAEIRKCSSLIRLISMAKSETEIVQLTHAAEISEQVGMAGLKMAVFTDRLEKVQLRNHKSAADAQCAIKNLTLKDPLPHRSFDEPKITRRTTGITGSALPRGTQPKMSRHPKADQAPQYPAESTSSTTHKDKAERMYRRIKKPRPDGPGKRWWRTRPDRFAELWAEVEKQLSEVPFAPAKRFFLELQRRYPGKFPDGQLRTFQRRVREWRVAHIHAQIEAETATEALPSIPGDGNFG